MKLESPEHMAGRLVTCLDGAPLRIEHVVAAIRARDTQIRDGMIADAIVLEADHECEIAPMLRVYATQIGGPVDAND